MMQKYRYAFMGLACGLLLASSCPAIYGQATFTPQQLYTQFYNIYSYLPTDCKDASDNSSYVDALKYLYAYTYIGNEALADRNHQREVEDALEYLERVARDIDDCVSSAGVGGRSSSPGDSWGSSVVEKPGLRSYPQNLGAIMTREQLQESLNYWKNRAGQLERENQQLRAANRQNSGQIVRQAPKIISPVNYQVYDIYPRQITCRWNPVPGAVSYTIDVFYQSPGNNGYVWVEEPWTSYSNITGTSKTISFVGAQPGGWEVYAVYADGTHSPSSARGTFISRR